MSAGTNAFAGLFSVCQCVCMYVSGTWFPDIIPCVYQQICMIVLRHLSQGRILLILVTAG